MSQAVMQEIIQKAVNDKQFAERLVGNSAETLAVYQTLLTKSEFEALQTMRPELLSGVNGLLSQNPPQSWNKPRSFKEFGAGILSMLLLLLLIYAAVMTYLQLQVPPLVYQVGDNFHVVDTFDRARDVLNIFFPLMSAVVTFWLGVAVESRRADQSEESAETARQQKQQAETSEKQTVSASHAALETVRQQVARLRNPSARNNANEESFDPNMTFEAFQAQQTSVDDILRTIDAARLDIGR